jgi:hypothetical protein
MQVYGSDIKNLVPDNTGALFVGTEWLKNQSIHSETVKKLGQRYPSHWITVGEYEYFNYDFIPSESRAKLPAKHQLIEEAEEEESLEPVRRWNELLTEALASKSVAKYRDGIRKKKLPVTEDKVVLYAKKAASSSKNAKPNSVRLRAFPGCAILPGVPK